ncbi:Putative member of CRISPR array [Oenococcus kitaharae DSM 17330]|uniref:Putative member of CRISPR array n=1 Tax=Oenococcus kitaharae DSM 17330 TaxID=1045004 RepID=G9WGV2_9LACO|nr:Putative member of CRISPR array [Oenococcus kitaharae DSM 17330]
MRCLSRLKVASDVCQINEVEPSYQIKIESINASDVCQINEVEPETTGSMMEK